MSRLRTVLLSLAISAAMLAGSAISAEATSDAQTDFVKLGNRLVTAASTSITPGKITAAELEAALAQLPDVNAVDLRKSGLSDEDYRQLIEKYPDISFLKELTFRNVTFLSDVDELDLSNIPMTDTQEVEDLLPCLPNLTKVIMSECGISNEEMDALNKRYEDVRFVWTIHLGQMTARTDDTWFAPVTQGTKVYGDAINDLRYCTDLECIDIGHSWVVDCEWARDMKNLKYLIIAETSIKDLSPLENHEKLEFLELFITPVRDYSPLLTCTGLRDLNIGFTHGDPTPLHEMTWLNNLWWANNEYPATPGWVPMSQYLSEGLPNTTVKLYSGSSTGFGWRNLDNYYKMRDMIGMYYMQG